MGEGEATGDEKSNVGLVARWITPFVLILKAGFIASSSDGGISTSFNKDDKNEGSPTLLTLACALGAGDVLFGGRRLGPATGGDADADSIFSIIRRVLGRFSLRSGSVGGSAGDAVTDRDFRLREVLGEAVVPGISSSRAFSNAPQALLSSAETAGNAS